MVCVTPTKSLGMWSRCDVVAASQTTPLSCPVRLWLVQHFPVSELHDTTSLSCEKGKAVHTTRTCWWNQGDLPSIMPFLCPGPSLPASLVNDPCPFSSGKPSGITPHHGVSLVTGLSSRVTICVSVWPPASQAAIGQRLPYPSQYSGYTILRSDPLLLVLL